ncbi:MAG: tRNA lysidine(34) synthetase TilS [Pseudomonadota bacterium]
MSVAERPQTDPPPDDLVNAVQAMLLPDMAQKIGVAVSGGGDSLALLHVLAQLSWRRGLVVEAVTVNHGLRQESEAEAHFVAECCASMGVPHHTLRWQSEHRQGNLMAAARDARYRLIADWATERNITAVMLGHTADDVAENFLIRLARKAGPDGLAAMNAQFDREGITWLRPFLQQTRADLRTYLRAREMTWVEDPTNDDDNFERTRARKAMAVLKDLGLSVDILQNVSLSMQAARHALDHYANIESRRYIVQQGGDLVLKLGLTGPLPDEIKRRLWRMALPWINGAEFPPRQDALTGLLASMASLGSGTVGGCLITRRGDDWRITREYQAVRDLSAATTALWDDRWRLDGPHSPDLSVRALGEAVQDCPDWRKVALPRTSLIATPAIWRGNSLVAAPSAGLNNGWTAQIVADFHQSAFAH